MSHYDSAYEDHYDLERSKEQASRVQCSGAALTQILAHGETLITSHYRHHSRILAPQYVQDALEVIRNYHKGVLYDHIHR